MQCVRFETLISLAQAKNESAPVTFPILFSQVLLLLGNYCEQTASWESNAIMRQYKEVIKVRVDKLSLF